MEAALPDIVTSMLSKVRYVVPSLTDINPTRWLNHPFWNAAGYHLRTAIEGHAFSPTPAWPDLITPLEAKRGMIDRQLIGLARTAAVLHGFQPDQAEDVPEFVADLLRHDLRERSEEAQAALERARAGHGVLR